MTKSMSNIDEVKKIVLANRGGPKHIDWLQPYDFNQGFGNETGRRQISTKIPHLAPKTVLNARKFANSLLQFRKEAVNHY